MFARKYMHKVVISVILILFAAKGHSQEPCCPVVALKSNLLFDLAGAPNAGVEVALGRRFSAGADFAYAWWRINNLYALQTKQGGVNVKFWFRPRERLTGWHTGIYATWISRYDVQWRDGWQGDALWSTGVSVGRSMPVAKRLNLEFLLAAGYLHTLEARHYTRPENGHLMWDKTVHNASRFSITKAQINLVWLLRR